MPERHPSGIQQSIVDKVTARRGRMHAFTRLDATQTALVVIDLDAGSVSRGETEEVRAFLPLLNNLASELRSHGGTIMWVTTPIVQPTPLFRAIYGDNLAGMYRQEGAKEPEMLTLWHELAYDPEDLFATKRDASAFFPGKSNVHEQLQARGVESVLICGLVTNVCCESSARDAYELGYEVTLVSDCLLGHKQGQHAATLATFYRNFGDVRPSDDILGLIANPTAPA